jgi:hypothetical protein
LPAPQKYKTPANGQIIKVTNLRHLSIYICIGKMTETHINDKKRRLILR